MTSRDQHVLGNQGHPSFGPSIWVAVTFWAGKTEKVAPISGKSEFALRHMEVVSSRNGKKTGVSEVGAMDYRFVCPLNS